MVAIFAGRENEIGKRKLTLRDGALFEVVVCGEVDCPIRVPRQL